MGDSLGGADLVHFGAFTRQDARNQNRTARVVAQGLTSVDQLDRSDFKRHVEHHREICRSGDRVNG